MNTTDDDRQFQQPILKGYRKNDAQVWRARFWLAVIAVITLLVALVGMAACWPR